LNSVRNAAMDKYRIGRQQASDARQDKLVSMQEAENERAVAAAEEQKGALDALLQGIDDPHQRLLAKVDPKAFIAAYMKPKDPWANVKTVGGQLVTPDGKGGVTPIYTAPETQKETWGQPFEVMQDGKPVLVRQSNLGKIEPVAGYAPKAEESGGPFAGTSMDAQSYNILLQGDPSSPEYAAAYSHLSQPRMQFDQTTGQMVTIRPDMSAFRRPQAGPQTVAMPQPNLPGGETAGMPQPNIDTAGTVPMPQPSFAQNDRGGVTVEAVPGVTPKMTRDQGDAATYADRMQQSHTILNDMDAVGSDVFGTITGNEYYPNVFKSDDRQKMEQAQRDFVNALLRRESGAVISDDEFDNAAKQYFPQPGDSDAVIAQKKANRETAIKGLVRAAGPAYKPPPPIPSLPDVTEEDIQHTAQKYHMTRQQVIQRLTTPDASDGQKVR
jgi:hypothetical protein